MRYLTSPLDESSRTLLVLLLANERKLILLDCFPKLPLLLFPISNNAEEELLRKADALIP